MSPTLSIQQIIAEWCGCMMLTMIILLAEHSLVSSGSACLPFSLSSLHALASLWSVAAGHITPEDFLMGQ